MELDNNRTCLLSNHDATTTELFLEQPFLVC